jgi:hypothetical protein
MLIIDNVVAAEMTLTAARKFTEARFYTQTYKAEDLAKDFRDVQLWAQIPKEAVGPSAGVTSTH